MKYVLWALQVLLGLSFVGAGLMKASQPLEALAAQAAWMGALPEPLLRFIGVAELLGGLGLILPAATRIQPWLTPLAAALLALVMVLALLFHVVRGELDLIVPNVVLGGLAAFVAYGRWALAPILPRGHAGDQVAASADSTRVASA
jgi:putative oxidoreductase